jgi:DNA-binding PadR family transcriptional regulator
MLYDTKYDHHGLHAIGRHRGGHHGGPGWGHSGSGPFGSDGGRFGRKLTSNDLQLVLLALLAEHPAHGYELIRTLEERSGGFYAPSSGMVYPALTYLDEIGHTDSVAEGNRKLYTITAAGHAFLAEHRATADAILAALARIGSRMGDVRDAFSGAAETGPGDDALQAARHKIKHAVRAKHGCSPEEARRVAAILERAAAEIANAPDAAKGSVQ